VVRHTDTGFGGDQCGFQPANHGAPYCIRSFGQNGFVRASSTGSSSRYVDLFKHQCKLEYDCTYQLFGPATCANQQCGVAIPSKPVEWQSCPLFSHGLDADAFVRAWNNANDDQRAILSIIQLFDEQRSEVAADVPQSFIAWAKSADPAVPAVSAKLRTLRQRLEERSPPVTLKEIMTILGT
jgi:hypothetical protein